MKKNGKKEKGQKTLPKRQYVGTDRETLIEEGQKSYEERKRKLLRQRRRQSRLRRLKRRFLRVGLFSLAVMAILFLAKQVGSLSLFRKKVDASEIEIPAWVEQKLIEVNPYSRPGDRLKQVKGIVVHYVGNPGTTALQNYSYFSSLAQTHETYASSHFLIGMEGEIIQCIPLTEIAYCSNERNKDTISIECCHPDEGGQFTEDTYEALVRLTGWLCEAFGLDSQEAVIRHYDVTGKECPLYYVKNPEMWKQFLADLKEREE